jgi:hypothetical protein
MKQMSLAVLGVALALAAPAQAANCEAQASREATLDATGATEIHVEARAGALRIEGRPGTSKVTVRGTACASDGELLEQIRLVAERRGSVAYVEAVMPEHEGWGFGRS